jgi:hypothetical protein
MSSRASTKRTFLARKPGARVAQADRSAHGAHRARTSEVLRTQGVAGEVSGEVSHHPGLYERRQGGLAYPREPCFTTGSFIALGSSAKPSIAMSLGSYGDDHEWRCRDVAVLCDQQDGLRLLAPSDDTLLGHIESNWHGRPPVSRSLCRSLEDQSRVAKGASPWSGRSRKPVWAISPSGCMRPVECRILDQSIRQLPERRPAPPTAAPH